MKTKTRAGTGVPDGAAAALIAAAWSAGGMSREVAEMTAIPGHPAGRHIVTAVPGGVGALAATKAGAWW